MPSAYDANPNSTTLWLEWGGDLVVSQNGSLSMATGWDQVRQRILRRLLSNPAFTLGDGTPVAPDLIFDTSYGIGCRRRLGELWIPSEQTAILSMVEQAVLVDEGIDATRTPTIVLDQNNHIITMLIKVVKKDGTPGDLVLKISNGNNY